MIINNNPTIMPIINVHIPGYKSFSSQGNDPFFSDIPNGGQEVIKRVMKIEYNKIPPIFNDDEIIFSAIVNPPLPPEDNNNYSWIINGNTNNEKTNILTTIIPSPGIHLITCNNNNISSQTSINILSRKDTNLAKLINEENEINKLLK